MKTDFTPETDVFLKRYNSKPPLDKLIEHTKRMETIAHKYHLNYVISADLDESVIDFTKKFNILEDIAKLSEEEKTKALCHYIEKSNIIFQGFLALTESLKENKSEDWWKNENL